MALVDRHPEAEVRLKGCRQGMLIGNGRLSLVFRVWTPVIVSYTPNLVDVRRDVRPQKKNAKEENRRQPRQCLPKGAM